MQHTFQNQKLKEKKIGKNISFDFGSNLYFSASEVISMHSVNAYILKAIDWYDGTQIDTYYELVDAHTIIANLVHNFLHKSLFRFDFTVDSVQAIVFHELIILCVCNENVNHLNVIRLLA